MRDRTKRINQPSMSIAEEYKLIIPQIRLEIAALKAELIKSPVKKEKIAPDTLGVARVR